jgi:uncharacterized phage protein gp47/JayE
MIDFSTGYSYREILDAMLGKVSDTLDKREGSLIQTALGPLAWYLEGLALTLAQVQRAAYAETAEGEDLDLLAATRGLTRRAAVAAVRQGSFNVAIPEGSLFRTVNGDSSVLFMSGEQISTSGGLYVYRMTCQTPGVIGNSYSGNITPVTAIAGLTTAVLGTIITEGADQESDNALRARYVASFDTAPYGGNIPEYRQAILKISGVGAVQVYPANQYHGGGTALCSIVNADFGPASPALVKTVQDIICPPEDGQTAPSPNGYGIAPVGAAVDIVSATAVTINVSCRIIFASGVEDGLASYGDEIRAAVAEYIHSVAEDWGKALVSNRITYPVTVYASRIIYAILTIPEVASVADLTINGASGDLTLTETAALQQVPVLGEVTLNG